MSADKITRAPPAHSRSTPEVGGLLAPAVDYKAWVRALRLEHYGFTGAEARAIGKAILKVLVKKSDAAGVAVLSVADIARASDRHKNTVSRYLSRLDEGGLVAIERRKIRADLNDKNAYHLRGPGGTPSRISNHSLCGGTTSEVDSINTPSLSSQRDTLDLLDIHQHDPAWGLCLADSCTAQRRRDAAQAVLESQPDELDEDVDHDPLYALQVPF